MRAEPQAPAHPLRHPKGQRALLIAAGVVILVVAFPRYFLAPYLANARSGQEMRELKETLAKERAEVAHLEWQQATLATPRGMEREAVRNNLGLPGTVRLEARFASQERPKPQGRFYSLAARVRARVERFRESLGFPPPSPGWH